MVDALRIIKRLNDLFTKHDQERLSYPTMKLAQIEILAKCKAIRISEDVTHFTSLYRFPDGRIIYFNEYSCEWCIVDKMNMRD